MNSTCLHHDIHANVKDRKLNAAYITSSYYMVYHEWRLHNTCIFVWYFSLSLIFLLVTEGFIFFSLQLWLDCSEGTEEWKLHFARKCLTRKWHIKCGKMSKALRLACFFRMQKPIGTRKCQLLTISLPAPGFMQAWKQPFYFIYIFCFNDSSLNSNAVIA